MKYLKFLIIGIMLSTLAGCSETNDIELRSEMPASEESVEKAEEIEFTGENYDALPKEQRIVVELKAHIDGDTTRFLIDGQEVKVRYLLIDTPETVKSNTDPQPFGYAASDRTKQLLTEAEKIEIMLDRGQATDAYDRLLAYIFVDDQLIQDVLIREGLARVAYVNEPSTTYLQQLQASQEIAQNEELGIWGIVGYVTTDGFLSE